FISFGYSLIYCFIISDFRIIVSGSKDGSCIVWDLSKLCFIRQLGPHPGPVSAVCVNELTSDIASTSGTHLFLWSLSGELIAAVNTASSEKLDTLELILCVGFSSYNEWDPQNVIITGSNDGIVRMWSLEYVQVPLSESIDDDAPCGNAAVGKATSKLNSEGSEHSFSGQFSEKVEFDTDEGKRSSARSCSPLSHDSAAVHLTKQSLSDSFVYVNNEGVAVVRTPARLRKGFKWERRLIFRSKLSMHTAFERKDNPTPAAITAVQPSKDHRTLYVGDARGRVWAWSVDETGGGGRADHWVQDPSRCMCSQCHQKFTLTERKHHCRNCGQIFCSKCSRFESEIKHLHIKKPVRVCQNCYLRLEASLNHNIAGGHPSSSE
ncbi:unnamed protein product, partial [Soboliphyme baturini]|uniref:FYVE-type domain-containing protein n=1 Tax=Soboliphyme baturini TaxID=241478 RepID=A0A183J3Q5_9BILA